MNTKINESNSFNQEEVKADLNDLLNMMGNANESKELFELQIDLLPLMYREYLTSEWFAKADPERKRDWVNQYDHLIYILEYLDEFFSKYPGDIKLIEAKVEYKQPQLQAV